MPPSGLVLDAKSLLADRDRPGLPHGIFGPPGCTPSPLHFLHAILYEWTQPRAQPPKNAFCRPQKTRTTYTDGPPTLQSGPRYPRGRACPVGWPSAAPIPVDAGHPVWGGRAAVWGSVGTLPYKPGLWSVINEIMRQKEILWRVRINRTPQTGLYGSAPHGGHDPPKQGARRLRGQAPRTATPPGRLAPGDTWGPPAAWVGHRCRLSVSPEAGRTRFSRDFRGLRPPIQNCM